MAQAIAIHPDKDSKQFIILLNHRQSESARHASGLATAKSKADSTVCKNNLCQIGIGIQLYTADYGCYPPRLSKSDLFWADALTAYTGAQWPEDNIDTNGITAQLLGERPRSNPKSLYACPGYNRL
jgi:hypothetical protein